MAKTKALISCAVTAQLICAFVFAYANFWFSHAAAHIGILGYMSTESTYDMFMCEMFLKIVISIYVCVYVVIKFLINK